MEQISFIRGDMKYYTLFGDDFVADWLRTNKTNVIPLGIVVAKFARTYPKMNDGISINDTPVAEFDSEPIQDGNYYIGTGTFTYEGTSYIFSLDKDSVEITPIGEVNPTSSEPEPIIEQEEVQQVSEVKETQVVVEEETEEVPEAPEPEPEPESVTIEPEPEPEHEPEVEPEPEEFMSALDPRRTALAEGCFLGTRRAEATPMGMRAGEAYSSPGCVFGGHVKPRQEAKRSKNNKVVQPQVENVPVIPVRPATKKVVDVPKSVPKSVPDWAKKPVPDPIAEPVKVSEPVKVIPEPAVPAATETKDKKELKSELRASMPKEIADVIGDIPLPLLDGISEYTMSPVPSAAWEDPFYCRDNGWKRCGNWYGIDVTCNVSRFICNPTQGVHVEIPIKTCKSWLAVVKEK